MSFSFFTLYFTVFHPFSCVLISFMRRLSRVHFVLKIAFGSVALPHSSFPLWFIALFSGGFLLGAAEPYVGPSKKSSSSARSRPFKKGHGRGTAMAMACPGLDSCSWTGDSLSPRLAASALPCLGPHWEGLIVGMDCCLLIWPASIQPPGTHLWPLLPHIPQSGQELRPLLLALWSQVPWWAPPPTPGLLWGLNRLTLGFSLNWQGSVCRDQHGPHWGRVTCRALSTHMWPTLHTAAHTSVSWKFLAMKLSLISG